MTLTKSQLELDVMFLARRAGECGTFSCDRHRDYGLSSNSLVGMAYGVSKQAMPSDWDDYMACVRAVRHLPSHRRTPIIMRALKRAKAAVERKYPAAERRACLRKKRA